MDKEKIVKKTKEKWNSGDGIWTVRKAIIYALNEAEKEKSNNKNSKTKNLTDNEKSKIADNIARMMENEMQGFIYECPKCDFEHIWNQAIDSCLDLVKTYQEDEYVNLNDEKLNEYYVKGE